MCKTSIYDARNNFSALVKMAENGEVVEILRHNNPVAVIIRYSDYEKNIAMENPTLEKLKAFRAKWNLDSENNVLPEDYFDDAFDIIESNKKSEAIDFNRLEKINEE